MRSRLSRFAPPLVVMVLTVTLAMVFGYAAVRQPLAIPGSGQAPLDVIVPAPAAFTTPLGNGIPFDRGATDEDICPQNLDSTGTPHLPEDITPGCGSNGFPEPTGDTFKRDKSVFEEQERFSDGLGPVYNEKSCVNCHQGPVSGGWSHVTELRVGSLDPTGTFFVNPTIPINYGLNQIAGRSLVNALAICPDAQEITPDALEMNPTFRQTLRLSLNILGDGFVESIADNTIIGIANSQCSTGGPICGQYISVPVLESPGATAIGRFGWKDQQASLLSFASDAYLNEMGITNTCDDPDVTSCPNSVDLTTVCKVTQDPEDQRDDLGLFDIDHFATFMRGLQAPPPEDQQDIVDSGKGQSIANGQILFGNTSPGIGCAQCHVTSIITAPPGTPVDGGAFIVPAALGNKIIHPYSDFLLHDIGTGDGIVQNGPQTTINKMRTAPLWGLHTRSRFLHQGLVTSIKQAILAHGGEATDVINKFRFTLTPTQQQNIIDFLNSL